MLLIGVNRSPFTRRVAITLNIYGVPFEQHALSGIDNRAEVRASNPLGRIPALVLGSGETLIDSNAIIDHLDKAYGGDRPLTPRGGAERRAVRADATPARIDQGIGGSAVLPGDGALTKSGRTCFIEVAKRQFASRASERGTLARELR
jgi:glutathione S-transferase